ncbi:SatD family protein [Microbacterium sp. RD1]|uniref:SatD family protein n=1 Tax=Microbacterium sp. RD1 TaxID=3457313 RepID=UPI003FA59E99
MTSSAAVIADIVGSRRLGDRGAAQKVLEATIARVEAEQPRAERPLAPTVGDELQAVYPTLEDALAGLLLIQLALPDDVECRFGIGWGEIGSIPSRAPDLTDGPGWWAARAAIETVHALQQRAAPSARVRVVAAPEENAAMGPIVAFANAYLLTRDQLVGTMSERTRRLVYGRCLGRTQRSLAAAEDITQSAVSQALAAAGGGAIVEGFHALDGVRA